MSRVCDSPSPASRIGSYSSPSYSPYFKTPYTIFPGFLTVQMAPLATPASFGLFSSLFSSRQSPGRFPRSWLGFFRFLHVPLLVAHVPVTPRRPASTESAPLVPFLHLLILCACRCVASCFFNVTCLFSVLAECLRVVQELRIQQLTVTLTAHTA